MSWALAGTGAESGQLHRYNRNPVVGTLVTALRITAEQKDEAIGSYS